MLLGITASKPRFDNVLDDRSLFKHFNRFLSLHELFFKEHCDGRRGRQCSRRVVREFLRLGTSAGACAASPDGFAELFLSSDAGPELGGGQCGLASEELDEVGRFVEAEVGADLGHRVGVVR